MKSAAFLSVFLIVLGLYLFIMGNQGRAKAILEAAR